MDVICQVKSGMGKTVIFILSTLQQIEPVAGQVAALVLCHTRELAYQICISCCNSHGFSQTDSYEADSELLMNDGCATDGQIFEGGSQDELEVLDLSSFCFVLFFQVNLLFHPFGCNQIYNSI